MNPFFKHFKTSVKISIPCLIMIAILSACNSGRTISLATDASPLPTLESTAESTAEPIQIESFNDLQRIFKKIASAEPVKAQTIADDLYQTLASNQQTPWTSGKKVIFFYKGQAEQVDWRGSFNNWSVPGLVGSRIGETDLWIAYTELPEASRAEYKIVLNNKDLVVDSANPNTTFNGMTGINNVVALPGFSVTDESKKRINVAQGALTGDMSLDSQALGYTVNYRVYTPADYENLDSLPVLYVLDGNDFVDERMGALPTILDNMIADKRIRPVIAVFVDAREPGNPQHNRREDEFLVHPIEHARFIADELVPEIDRSYRTATDPESRLITGVSYGGLSAYFIAALRSDVFHNLAAFSPSLWVLDSPQYLTSPEHVEGSKQMLPAVNEEATACGGDTGFECPRLPIKIFLTVGLEGWDVGDFGGLVSKMKQQGYPVEFQKVREGHTWDHWRGLSDEMLNYFFGIR
jgi:enterochelin esterase-like enzyme